ncbi:hypothetical protein Y032_0001g83 [Ancylostoma ceylanicum]|uniref:Uncharacterized protein n=1 Tax=Ancylostoma ceylanicum TaxID=53326 RepID=A0A016W5W3_9BILA|nr:hypothetical protein Y032_0001g83 [Ancylostoma ceylanicum]
MIIITAMLANFLPLFEAVLSVHSLLAAGSTEVFSRIFSKYNPAIRPKHDASYITNVTVYLSLFSLLAVNEQTQTVRFTMDMAIEWTDPLLAWTSTGVDSATIKVPEQSVWTPDVMLFAATSKQDLINYERRLVVLRSDGLIVKSGPQVVAHPCQINVLKFPYDDQTCTFSVGSWSYTNANLRLYTPYEQYEPSKDFTGNTEWKLLSLTARHTVDSTYAEGDFDVLLLTVHLRRHPHFYTFAIIVPSFVCTFLCLNGLFLPSEISGLSIEKVSLGVCTLLAMALILQSVTASMPKSEKLPLLGVYVLAQTILCAIAVLITSIYLIVQERAVTRGWNPPGCLTNTFLTRHYDRKVTHSDEAQQDGSEPTRLSPYLESISAFLRETSSDSRLERMWARIFDRINVITLVVFQLANLVMTLVILL